METPFSWQWNEIQQVGTDYTDVAEVERYERRMGEFRDLAAEDAAILKTLALPAGSRILEIGTGTGHFARAAAKAGHAVTAADVSPMMLQYAAKRAQAEGAAITFVHAGFLTLPPALAHHDAVVSVAALHHLPDLWKAVALQNINRMLKPGGRLFLGDVVFSWKGENHPASFDAFVNDCPAGMRMEAARHVAKEYSTLGWIMEGLLRRAGFRIVEAVSGKAAFVRYLCAKTGAPEAGS